MWIILDGLLLLLLGSQLDRHPHLEKGAACRRCPKLSWAGRGAAGRVTPWPPTARILERPNARRPQRSKHA
jgi:hypothetical protein